MAVAKRLKKEPLKLKGRFILQFQRLPLLFVFLWFTFFVLVDKGALPFFIYWFLKGFNSGFFVIH